jgi:cytidyltransferase-like protein
MGVYDYCPICGEEGVQRERRPNGNDTCKNGHVYPSADRIKKSPVPKIVCGIVSGYFNPIHQGHLNLLRTAKSQCDVLFVIVNNDEQQKLKTGTIFMDQNTRMAIVGSLKMVDSAVRAVDKKPDISETLQVILSGLPTGSKVKFFNGGDRTEPDPREAKVCDTYGAEMVFLDQPKVDSSSNYRNLK